MRALLAALAVALSASPAGAVPLAVPALDFQDSSGELADQSGAHQQRLDRFVAALRSGLTESGRVEVVVPDCGDCSPARTPFPAMAEATRAAGAELLLVGNIHKVSTLIGTVRVTLIDLPGDRVVCTRVLSYRGDTDQAWTRAASFAAGDVVAHCLP